jgi:preprotein translocase subunit SecG
MAQQILVSFQIGVAILLGTVILIQQKGQGLSGAFGGEGGSFYRSKRGAEKYLFIATITLAALFIVLGLMRIIVVPLQTAEQAPSASNIQTAPNSRSTAEIGIPEIEVVAEPVSSAPDSQE